MEKHAKLTEIRNDRTSLPVQDLCLVFPHSFTSCTNTVASSVDRAKLDRRLALILALAPPHPGSARRNLGLSAGFGHRDTLLTHVPCARRCKIDGFDSANTRTPRRPADQLQHTEGQRGPSMHHARGLPRGGRSGGNGSCLGCAREAAPSAIGRPQPHVRHASRKGGKLLFRSLLFLALCRSSSSSSRRDPAHIFCWSLGVGAGRVSSCTGRERVANCA